MKNLVVICPSDQNCRRVNGFRCDHAKPHFHNRYLVICDTPCANSQDPQKPDKCLSLDLVTVEQERELP